MIIHLTHTSTTIKTHLNVSIHFCFCFVVWLLVPLNGQFHQNTHAARTNRYDEYKMKFPFPLSQSVDLNSHPIVIKKYEKKKNIDWMEKGFSTVMPTLIAKNGVQ